MVFTVLSFVPSNTTTNRTPLLTVSTDYTVIPPISLFCSALRTRQPRNEDQEKSYTVRADVTKSKLPCRVWAHHQIEASVLETSQGPPERKSMQSRCLPCKPTNRGQMLASSPIGWCIQPATLHARRTARRDFSARQLH